MINYNLTYCFSVSTVIVVPDDVGSIQKAIEFAQEGQRIFVKAGVYKECIIVNKPLTIYGEDGAVIIGTGGAHTVQITANNVYFSGFTIRGKIDSPFSGIHVFYSSGSVIENNKVTEHYCGIQLYDSSNTTLTKNHMSGNIYNLEVWGLVIDHFIHKIDTTNYVNQRKVYFLVNKHRGQVPSDAGYVALVNCSNILVKDSMIIGNGEGILVAYTKNSLIYNVTSTRNKRGIRLTSSSNNEILQCNLTNNDWVGIVIEASSNNTVHECVISKNVKGIILSESNILNKRSLQNTVAYNNISQNTYGAWLSFSSSNEFCQNYISKNHHNIVLESSENNVLYENVLAEGSFGMSLSYSEKNIVYCNNFVNNTVQVYVKDLFSKNIWDNGSRGNFWSNYTGVDMDGDGVGDTPHGVNANDQDRYPLMKPWTIDCDVRVVSVIPLFTEVYVGQVVDIKVIISYKGSFMETFPILCKSESDNMEQLIGIQFVTVIPQTNVALTFAWMTKDIALHKIKVEIPRLENETNLMNNVMVSFLTVKVKKSGDVNGDQVVDMKDIALTALSFGSNPNNSRWDSRADLNNDQKIDLKDLVIIAKSFGK
jgi:parallel beta-helix repeat protein